MRTIDDAVSQTIRDVFKLCSPEMLDIRKVGGLALRERLKKDKERFKATGEPMGKRYYASLKSLYRSCTDPEAQLQPSKPADAKDIDVVSDELVTAMVAANKAKPERSKMQAYCSTSKHTPNQTEACGILCYFISLKYACAKQQPVAMDILRWVARTRAHVMYPERWDIVRVDADRALEAAWARAKMTSIWTGSNSSTST